MGLTLDGIDAGDCAVKLVSARSIFVRKKRKVN